MFLSTLLVNVGDNPDRPRPGRLWLRNLYRVHQRLCMAFPSSDRQDGDPHFLKPFAAGDFAAGHIHVQRTGQNGFLFRIDPLPAGRAAIVVQSADLPDWDYAFHNAQHLLAAPPSEPRPVHLTLALGDRFHFRLLVNPTIKKGTLSKEERLQRTPGRHGQRVPVRSNPDELRDWLTRRAERCGFRTTEITAMQPGYVYLNKTREPTGGQRLRSLRYEGVLEVTDTDAFGRVQASGIGPAKAFGFGLLSLAPA